MEYPYYMATFHRFILGCIIGMDNIISYTEPGVRNIYQKILDVLCFIWVMYTDQ